jgi:predicted TIM-barrel fold metal-dependent hydrolase
VDYHQHLLSKAGLALLQKPTATVAVPADVQALFRSMTERWNNPAALAELYTEDVVAVANLDKPLEPWVRGRQAASQYVGTVYGRPYTLTPVFYRQEGNHARVAGFFTRGEGDAARHFAYFYFDLVRQPDKELRIAVDVRTLQQPPKYLETISGEQLVKLLDAAGIRQAVVLSDAYFFDSPEYRQPGQSDAEVYASVRAENDWTAQQTSASNGRLIAFCSFNPLAEHALRELRRCKSLRVFRGLKLHLQMSQVDMRSQSDVRKLKRVFKAADELRMPIMVHAQTRENYNADAARTFISEVATVAPSIPVVIAHLWGGGPFAPEPLEVYVAAVEKGLKGTKNLYFDVAEAALVAGGDKSMLAKIADAIRRVGPDRILFGSDAVGTSTLPPDKAAAQFRRDIPMTDEEFAKIADNKLPFMPQ